MFDNISHRYDFLNHLLSMGVDRLWRRHAVNLLAPIKPKIVLDVATGTGDFALEALRLKPDHIIGLDISEGMLQVGRTKIAKRNASGIITMQYGDSEQLPFADNYADAVTVGFGARNFENLEQGLREIHRVLRPGGRAIILEPGFPSVFPLKQAFKLYFTTVLPLLGRMVSKDSSAYTYLPESVKAFPEGQAFVDICNKAGFAKAVYKPLTFGICALYQLEK